MSIGFRGGRAAPEPLAPLGVGGLVGLHGTRSRDETREREGEEKYTPRILL